MTELIKAHVIEVVEGIRNRSGKGIYTRVTHGLPDGSVAITGHVTHGNYTQQVFEIQKENLDAIKAGSYKLRKTRCENNCCSYDRYNVVVDREWRVEQEYLSESTPTYNKCFIALVIYLLSAAIGAGAMIWWAM